jgi:hypothetical protein
MSGALRPAAIRSRRRLVVYALLLAALCGGAVYEWTRDREGQVDPDTAKRAEETVRTMRALAPPPPDPKDLPATPNRVPGRGPQGK